MSGPVIVGSILIGANEVVGELVRSHIPYMSNQSWGEHVALGVIRRGELLGGVVYHGYRGFDIQMSCAFDRVGWALPGTVRALMSYPFNDLGVVRVTSIVGRRNKRSKKLVTDLGFRFIGVARKGLDGVEDAFLYEMLRDECKWIKPRVNNGQASTIAAAAA